jgi:hypothetical protein
VALAGKDCSPDKKTGFTFRGKEIVLSKTRGRPLHPHWKKGFYTDRERIEAATLYAALGSIPRVGELTGISQSALRGWVREDWFKALLDEIRAENDQKIDVRFNEIISDALDQLGDRVKNGDFILTKTGEMIRKPVGARDLSIVTAINIDKRQLLRNKPTTITEKVSDKSTDQKLLELKQSFERLVGKKIREPETIDAEVVQEGEDGPLQEGPTA